MSTEVVMPQMGESIAEGTITKWLKKVGERVERDEPLFEISTDKVDAEIPSPAAGTLTEVRFKEGDTVEVNTVVAVFDGDGAGAANSRSAPQRQRQRRLNTATSAAPSAQESAKSALPTGARVEPPATTSRNQTRAASAATSTRAATCAATSARTIRRCGDRGRPAPHKIQPPRAKNRAGTQRRHFKTRRHRPKRPRHQKRHPELYRIRQRPRAQAAAPQRHPQAPTAAPAPPAPAELPAPPAPKPQMGDRVEPMSVMRKKIAEHMVLSRRTSAHVTTVYEIDMTRVAKLREQHRDSFYERTGTKLTFMPFIFEAVNKGLRKFPIFNAQVSGEQIIYKQDINLGMAVALDWGLIVPVIKRADDLSISGLARAANDLADRARTKQLKPDEVTGGTFTITNPGVFGGLFGTPIINQPQLAILGVGKIEKRPKVLTSPDGDDFLGIRWMAYFALSFDHRVIDGADAERFLAFVKEQLESGEFSV